jgi:CRISPR-associated endonuclease Csn1
MSEMLRVSEDLVLGIDLGIASCGWALIRDPDRAGEIVAMGVRTFDVPETAKERKPLNAIRRESRLLRRVLRRRRQRMNKIRELFEAHGLLPHARNDALALGLDPWRLRTEGLDRPLLGAEFAAALGHIAKHRGFKSNSKRDAGDNAPAKTKSETIKAKGGALANRDYLRAHAKYRTIGEMFAKDERFSARKRNKDKDYKQTMLRDLQQQEVTILFARQRQMGSSLAGAELEEQFIATAFFQRPLQDAESRVGFCPFEPGERRAAKHSPAFERFRAAQRLAHMPLRESGFERRLTPDEIARVLADFGKPGTSLTYRHVRNVLALPGSIGLDAPKGDEKLNIATRSGDATPGTKALRNVLGDAWATLADKPEATDAAAACIAFRETPESIREGLAALDLHALVLERLMKGVEEGDFAEFSGAGHISAKAARRITEHLLRGLTYDEACAAAGYTHSDRPDVVLDDLANPVARRCVGEALKQFRAIAREWGLPGAVHIEFARDIGKSPEERRKIEDGIEARNVAKDKLRECFLEQTGRARATAEDLLRFELWREQGGKCVYTGDDIHIDQVASGDPRAEVDHILPWSRSGDDSFVNKTLCTDRANREKRGRTPFEWLDADPARWAEFVARVETNKAFKGRKKRNYTLRDASVLETKFRARNLNDTRYAIRVFAGLLEQIYQPDQDKRRRRQGERRIFARPGGLTDRLRRAWGLQVLKKDDGGKRVADDRHHAIDAFIVAATTESALNRLTQAAQREEQLGSHRFIADFPPPWEGFRDEAMRHYERIFVSRAERGRMRGKGHDATIRALGERDGETVVFERKSVEDLTEKDLDRLKDRERNHKLVDALRAWIVAGKPKDQMPRSPKGDPIAKVKLLGTTKLAVLIRGGTADRGEMVRVDVFRKEHKSGTWQFFLVPIYPHQVADRERWPEPPDRYVSSGGKEAPLTPEHEFIFSISQRSFLKIEKEDGTFMDGYFKGLDRNTGAISLSPHTSLQIVVKSIGVRTLKRFAKFRIDRLGNRFEVEREARTWRGKVCT